MKKNLFTVLILALLIVNIALTSITMVSVTSTNKKTADLVTNIATTMKLDLTVPGTTSKANVSLADTAVYNFTSAMTIPLKSENEKKSYIMFNIALSMNVKHEDYKTYKDTIADNQTLIEDAITTVVGNYTESECRADFDALKEEILEAVQGLFRSDFIYNVAISEIKFG